MKRIKNLISILSMLMLIMVALPSCGWGDGEKDDEFCKVSVTSSVGGTAFASETDVMSGWEVTLIASPNPGYVFVNWTVNGTEVSTENPYKTVVSANTQFRANFRTESGNGGDESVDVNKDIMEGEDFIITITPEGAGKVSTYIQKRNLTLISIPNDGYEFESYSINGEVVSKESIFAIDINGFTEIFVNFLKKEPIPPVSAEMEYVDLGLSVKWATCNLGATKPEESGNYYSWGETSVVDCITSHDYKWSEEAEASFTKYCTSEEYGKVDNKTTLDLEDDAAYVALGGNWRMPTKAEFNELLNTCKWTWTIVEGVFGYRVSSYSNGNSIFIPVVGVKTGYGTSGEGYISSYWSSTLSNKSDQAMRLLVINDPKEMRVVQYARWIGCPIRPVYADK
ncbi:MAG: hypothetical protein IKV14_05080 [Muribaculaceae bacterium]|nr:hypothetical protein [Muribaculaceae bacterium]